MSSVAAVFAERGPLAEVKANYRPRKVQVDMALAVEQATQTKQALVVEAGTGTGKTFAYLAPALLQKGKVVISTGTKNLQEQLYSRDLPYMQKVLKLQRSAALLKGRANYLCLHRMDQNRQFNLLKDDQLQNDMTQVRKWASTTQTGDLGELTGLAEDAAVLPMVTSTVDNCLGKDCPDHAECYLIKARRKAMEAEVVVINHHLFFADMVLKDTGFGELIPDAKMIVFDEAHQLTQIATECNRFIKRN
jgi:ATP-dependent DNA helicase DinG